jgi:outer membrane protein assembly factor BamB
LALLVALLLIAPRIGAGGRPIQAGTDQSATADNRPTNSDSDEDDGRADGTREPGVLPLAAKWSVDLGGPPVARATPLVDAAHVYVALRAGHIVARRLRDGAEQWRKDLPTDQPLALDSGVVFVSSRDAIHALRGADGAILWERPLSKITAPLVARAGWLIVLAEGRLLAFRSTDGAPIWQRDIGGSTQPPAIDGDRLYVSLDDGRIVAVNLETGASIWERAIGATPGAPFASGDRLYAGASDRQFYCLKTETGEIDWVKRIGAAIVGSATVDVARVYFLALDNIVRALDRSNGNQRWQHAYRRRASTGPTIGGTFVFVASASSPDIWMWTTDGKPAGTLSLPAESAVPPAVAERSAGELDVLAVTGSLSSEWQLTLLTTAHEPPLVALPEIPGVVLPPETLSVPVR